MVLAEATEYLDSVETRLAEVQFADDVTSKRKTTACLQELDSVCELALDLIHSLQRKISSLSPSIAVAVHNLAARHASLSADVQVSYIFVNVEMLLWVLSMPIFYPKFKKSCRISYGVMKDSCSCYSNR